MPGTSDPNASQSVLDDAALWYARLDSGTADESAFERWRQADPAHAIAFAKIVGASEAIGHIPSAEQSRDQSKWLRFQPSRRTLLSGIAVLAASAAVGVPWLVTRRAYAEARRGERKSIVLPDGGRLELNTDTKVSWKYEASSRRVWLAKGEIAVRIPARKQACEIITSRQSVTTGEGELNLRLRDGTLDVTVLHGSCVLNPQPNQAIKVDLTSGQSALASDASPRVRTLASSDLRFVAGWQKNEILLEGQTLGVAVAEYNRYLDDKLVVADPQLEGLRVGGRFTTDDPSDFLNALESSFGVRATKSKSGTIFLTQ